MWISRAPLRILRACLWISSAPIWILIAPLWIPSAPLRILRVSLWISSAPIWILIAPLWISTVLAYMINPLMSAAVSKPLEIIVSPTYVLAWQEPTAPESDINQTAGSPGRPSMWQNRCMHAAVCLLHAGQPKRAGDAAKSGEFPGDFFLSRTSTVRGLSVPLWISSKVMLIYVNLQCSSVNIF